MNYERLNFLLEQVRNEGEDAFLLYGIAMEYFGSDLTKAHEYLEQTRRKYPDYLPTYYKLGSALDELDRPEEALVILEEGIEIAKRQNDRKALQEIEQYASNLRMELD